MEGSPSWLDVLDRLARGDRLAFMELNRLVTAFLVRARVHDLADEWDDLRQEVVLAVVASARAGRLREPDAFTGFVKTIVRNKVADRLGERYRSHEMQGSPWEDVADELIDATSWTDLEDADQAAALWRAVGALPEEERAAIRGIYADGKTYEAVAADTGIPLGTLKRRLRTALTALREKFGESAPPRDPIAPAAETSSKGGPSTRRIPS
jgi:RNA polymerase sigma-70 factor (ECF subfamily)